MRSGAVEGVVLVDKPAGVTSHDVVAIARRALGERRIGHTGTLDPFATGLLVLLVGRATRVLPYVDGEPKIYDATIRFGAETDTDDATGEVTRSAPQPDASAVSDAMRELTGTFEQVPPAYSAKRVAGRRAYASARRGASVTLAPARVTVHEWIDRGRRDADLDVTITCAGGTYVRALARDLGRKAGSAAHLIALRRTRSGPFDLTDACSLASVRAATCVLRPVLDALPSLAIEVLEDEQLRRAARGMPVPARRDGERAALVDASGHVLAIAERSGDAWQPRAVLVES